MRKHMSKYLPICLFFNKIFIGIFFVPLTMKEDSHGYLLKEHMV